MSPALQSALYAWGFILVSILIWTASALLLSVPLSGLPRVGLWALSIFGWTTSAIALIGGCLHARLAWKIGRQTGAA